MKNINKKIIMALGFLLVLTGCTNTQYKVKVYDGGSSQFLIDHAIDSDLIPELSELDLLVNNNEELPEEVSAVNFLFQETAYALHKAGFEITPFEEERVKVVNPDEIKEGEEDIQPTYVANGFKATRHFESTEDFNDILKKLNETELININGELSYKNNIINKDYQFLGELKFFDQSDKIEEYSELDNIGDFKEILEGFSTQFEIDLPGKIKATTSEDKKGNKWVADYTNALVDVKIASQDLNKKFLVASGVVILVAVPLILSKTKKKKVTTDE